MHSRTVAGHSKRTHPTPVLSAWWRAGEYEICGDYIKPKDGTAITQYHPLKDFEETRRTTKTNVEEGQSAFAALANVLSSIGLGGITAPLSDFMEDAFSDGCAPFIATPDRRQAILDWCQRFGLLGLLQHQVQSITLAPRYRSLGNHVVPQQTSFVRVRGTWVKTQTGNLDDPKSRSSLGKVADAATGMVAAHAVVERLTTSGLGTPDSEPLARLWHTFFPSVGPADAETFEYPEPPSALPPAMASAAQTLYQPFWSLYAEPVEEFLKAAVMLVTAFTEIETGPTWPRRLAKIKRVGHDPHLLTGMMAPLSITTSIEPGKPNRIRQQFIYPSLLSALAQMRYLDHCGDVWFRRCPCGRFFETESYQGLHCCKTHAQRYAKRRQRAPKNKSKKKH